MSDDTQTASIQLVNRALGQLGVDKITSFDDDSEAAEKASLNWGCLRDSLLRAHYWKFASYTDTLAQIANETILQWTYLYAYPPKCLMIRKIFDESCMNPGGDLLFDMEFFGDMWLLRHPEFRYKETLSPTSLQKSIACNVKPAFIEYTYQVTDPNVWDQAFQDCMVYSLAAELAHPLTGNSDLLKKYTELAASIISEAKRLDAQEDNSTRPRMSSFVRARM